MKMMLFMHNSKYKKVLFITFSGVLFVGIVALGFLYLNEGKGPPGQKIPAIADQIENLRSFVDAANKASGITSGAVFNFKLNNSDGHYTNFSIVRHLDEVRSDSVVEEHAVTFSETGGSGYAEINPVTTQIVSMHRSIPEFADGEYSANRLESIVRDFLADVYPKFKDLESTLTFDPGMKGTRLNNGNYFFRWNDLEYKKSLPEGIEPELDPFIQVSITAGGFIFGYDNTIDMYRNALTEL